MTLFTLALVFRSVYLIFVHGIYTPMTGDEGAYHLIGVHFLETGRPLTNIRPPLLPAVLAFWYAVVGVDFGLARWLMVVLSSVSAPAIYLLAAKGLNFDTRTGLLAGLAWILYPPSIFYASYILTETTASLLVVLGLLTYSKVAAGRGWRWAALTGVLWGIASLNRSAYLLLPAGLLLANVLAKPIGLPCPWPWRQWLVAIPFMITTISPWTIYNYQQHSVVLFTEARLAYGLIVSNAHLADPMVQSGGYAKNPETIARLREIEKIPDQNRFAVEVVGMELKKNWRMLPGVVLHRAANFWTPRPDPFDPVWTRNDTIMLAVWLPIVILLIYSIRTVSWRRDWPALLIILYAFSATLPFWGSPRFRFPVDALLLIRAAAAAGHLLDRIRRRRPGGETDLSATGN